MKYFQFILFVTLLSFQLPVAFASRLPSVWCAYIADICSAFEAKQFTCTTVADHPQICTSPHGIQNPSLQLLPVLLLWSPLLQFQQLLPLGLTCPKCPSNVVSTLRAVGWMTGIESRRMEPRKIHGIRGVVLLVSRVYRCNQERHEVFAHHPGVLKQIHTPSVIPFKLWHKTGFTVELLQLVDSMLTGGVTICGIQEMLKRRAYSHYYLSKSRFEQVAKLFSQLYPDGQISREFTSIQEWHSYVPVLVPSRHALSGGFLATFWQKSEWFLCNMQSTTIDEEHCWLSCDHTFASAGE